MRDDTGLEWSVKLGPEAQSEVVSSRILWAIGFHQPPTYYVERWSLTGARSRRATTGPIPSGPAEFMRSSATGRGTRIHSSDLVHSEV